MWPNESKQYRAEREKLLEAEIELRAKAEEVASMRRALPEGGLPKENYEFIGVANGKNIRLSQLFDENMDTLFAYSFMFKPGGSPCPMCTALLDGLEKSIPHLTQRINVAVIAKATPAELSEYAAARGWVNLPLYSSNANSYNTDYRAEDENGNQMPIMHVWQRGSDGKVRHFWASELFFRNSQDWPFHPRHADPIWPLWNVFDLTPEGRGKDWYPQINYTG